MNIVITGFKEQNEGHPNERSKKKESFRTRKHPRKRESSCYHRGSNAFLGLSKKMYTNKVARNYPSYSC